LADGAARWKRSSCVTCEIEAFPEQARPRTVPYTAEVNRTDAFGDASAVPQHLRGAIGRDDGGNSILPRGDGGTGEDAAGISP
jgi:hypothetical protein